ncbi:hypothetical protein [Shewanella donghaensis]|uniref:hypothetical protein n=1 Tax=Shewanella donghaensis TaxID=238836 RepID=UPI001181F986|nr:hypothetical protein [Shewanella donghaensis]
MKILKKWQYIWQLKKAKKYSEKTGYKVIGSLKSVKSSSRVKDLINELSVSIPRDYIPQLQANKLDPISSYGGDCANLHAELFKFIKDHYPELDPVFTIGSVYFEGKPRYKFNEKLLSSPKELERFEAHAWITLGNELILDCTISTHLNVKVCRQSAFGPILFGTLRHNFEHKGLYQIRSFIIKDYSSLTYEPVMLGVEAMNAINPKS